MTSEQPTIKVLIADDHEVVRQGIRAFLSTKSGVTVVGDATNGAEAVQAALELQPDVILMDLVMPGVDGVTAIRQIRAMQPAARILVLTSFATDDQVLPAIRAGALGYLLKDSAPNDLFQAIERVYRGTASLHPAIARKALETVAQPSSQVAPPNQLTDRELEVLRLVAQGRNNAEIAAVLGIAEGAVRARVSSILGKLKLTSRAQAALYALREGIVSVQDAASKT